MFGLSAALAAGALAASLPVRDVRRGTAEAYEEDGRRPGCGGHGDGTLDTPAGSYQYSVTATSTSGTQIMQTVTLNLVVR